MRLIWRSRSWSRACPILHTEERSGRQYAGRNHISLNVESQRQASH